MLYKPLIDFIVKNVKFHYDYSPGWMLNRDFMLNISQEFLSGLVLDFEEGLLKVGEVVPQNVLLFPYHSKNISLQSEPMQTLLKECNDEIREEKDLELSQEVLDIIKTLSDEDENSSKNLKNVLDLLKFEEF